MYIPTKTRHVRKFLWFPLRLEGKTKWLVFADIVQEWEPGGEFVGYPIEPGWYSIEWVR